jgi:hypothetical protein
MERFVDKSMVYLGKKELFGDIEVSILCKALVEFVGC